MVQALWPDRIDSNSAQVGDLAGYVWAITPISLPLASPRFLRPHP
jgi:hypothetical protein